MNVTAPDKVRITTGTPGTLDCPTCDIYLTSGAIDTSLGPDVALNAGGSINAPGIQDDRHRRFIARSGDLNLDHAFVYDGLVGVGRERRQSEQSVLDSRGLAVPVGRPGLRHYGQRLPFTCRMERACTLAANRNLTLFLIETLGAVSLTATTGNITLNNDIGPHIINSTGQPDFNPADKGVASLTISAPANTATITMQGARAEGNVVITTGGTLTAAKQITSVNGTVSIYRRRRSESVECSDRRPESDTAAWDGLAGRGTWPESEPAHRAWSGRQRTRRSADLCRDSCGGRRPGGRGCHLARRGERRDRASWFIRRARCARTRRRLGGRARPIGRRDRHTSRHRSHAGLDAHRDRNGDPTCNCSRLGRRCQRLVRSGNRRHGERPAHCRSGLWRGERNRRRNGSGRRRPGEYDGRFRSEEPVVPAGRTRGPAMTARVRITRRGDRRLQRPGRDARTRLRARLSIRSCASRPACTPP